MGDLVSVVGWTTEWTIKEIVKRFNGQEPIYTYWLERPHSLLLAQETELTLIKTACECGKEQHGFAGHVAWCPAFKENFK